MSLEEVTRNFERYGLLDDQVRFLKGWFRDTLPVAPIGRLGGELYAPLGPILKRSRPKVSRTTGEAEG